MTNILLTLMMFTPLFSQSSNTEQQFLNTVRLGGRFNELESQDGYNLGIVYTRQIGMIKLGLGFELHTVLSGVWSVFDLEYQALNSKRGVGLTYSRLLGDSEDKPDYIEPIIVFISFERYPIYQNNVFYFEFRAGFDLQYLNPPGDAMLGALTGVIYGSSFSIGLKF